ncbi:uncharacterized protein LOC144886071 isoform X2 [Branchiostoma floridae x Branchiostoma japonicum]
MRLFVATLFVTMLVTAMLIEDSESIGSAFIPGNKKKKPKGWWNGKLQADQKLSEEVEEARSLLDSLSDLMNDPDEQLDLSDLRGLQEPEEQDDARRLW